MQRQTMRSTLLRWCSPVIGGGAILVAGAMLTPAHARQTDDQDLPRAEDLLDRHVEATGGKQAHLKLKSRKKTGKLAVDMAGHKFEAKIEEHFQAPNKSHILLDGSFFSQVTVCNGEDAWEWRPGHRDGERDASTDAGETRLLDGSQRTRALEQARFHSVLEWRERFASVQTLRVADVGRSPAYEVRVETKSGEQYSQFYAKASGRLVKRVRTAPTGHGEKLDMEVFLEDYREFDGVWIPTTIRAHLDSPTMGKGTQTWTYTKIEHNKKIPASLFKMPDELRERLDKESSGKKEDGHDARPDDLADSE